jgi:hypothetical protein
MVLSISLRCCQPNLLPSHLSGWSLLLPADRVAERANLHLVTTAPLRLHRLGLGCWHDNSKRRTSEHRRGCWSRRCAAGYDIGRHRPWASADDRGLFLLGALAFAAAAMVLSSTFNWPDILREPAIVVLPAFVGGGTSLVWTWFATAWTYAILAVPICLAGGAMTRRCGWLATWAPPRWCSC